MVSFLNRYKYTITLFIILQLIVFFQIRTAWYRGSYLFYFFNAFSLLLILHIISKGNFIISTVFKVVFSLLIAFEAYYAFFFNCSISLGIISSIMVTNINEASDVMKSRIIPTTIILGLTLLGVFLCSNELKRLKISIKWSLLLLGFYLIVFYPLYLFQKIKRFDDFASYHRGNKILSHQIVITERFPLLYGQTISVIAFLHEKKQEKKYLLRERTLPENVFFDTSEHLPKKIIFVVGESQNRKHLSLYGYDVKTTPFLDSLYETSSNMRVFDAISPGCTTLDVTRLLFSFATPNNLNPFYENKNLIELANDAGYQTIWLSNQTTFDRWGSVTTHISSLSNDSYFTGYEETAKVISDLKLIPKLKEKLINNKKQFFVIHLQGSHGSYSTKSDDIDLMAIKGNNIINEYDRSIHHTDRVLRELYNTIKADSSTLILYISDHGENVELGGHGFINRGFPQFDIPFFIINNCKIDIDSIVDNYFLHDKNRINAVSTINILAELMGYSFSEEIISELRDESYYIFHVNWKTYKWEELVVSD